MIGTKTMHVFYEKFNGMVRAKAFECSTILGNH